MDSFFIAFKFFLLHILFFAKIIQKITAKNYPKLAILLTLRYLLYPLSKIKELFLQKIWKFEKKCVTLHHFWRKSRKKQILNFVF